MAGIYVNDEGTWKLPKSIWINQLGTWRVCKNVYVNSSGSWREMIKTVDLTSSQQNFNLYQHVGSPAQPLSLTFNIESNVTISSYDVLPTGGYQNKVKFRYNIKPRTDAFTVGNFPAGSTVIINNNGYISGGGGFGGSGSNKISNGYNYPNLPGAKGGDASHGITKGSSNSFDITIVNTGTIAGGGGGGGGSGGYIVQAGIGQNNSGASYGFYNGGDGAGITGYSDSVGQSIAPPSQPNTWGGDGRGGDCGKNGQTGYTYGYNNPTFQGSGGGLGKTAINTDGIEIAVSGTILGGVG